MESQKKTKKQFVRNILVALFGYYLLTESTISGKASNRAEQPMTEIKALDPKKVLAIKGTGISNNRGKLF